MIQRIQTLYLLVVTIFVGVTLFAPLAWFFADSVDYRLCAFSLQTLDGTAVQSTVYMGLLLVASCLLPLVTIFLYRRRMLQIRLCVVEMVLLLGSVVMEGIYYYLCSRAFADVECLKGLKPAIALPLVSLFFMYLAVRAIFRDELMVRAADRIR